MDAAVNLSTDEARTAIEDAWRLGDLSWTLQPHQLRVYERIRTWELTPAANDNDAQFASIFTLDIGRRWGKTWLCLVIAIGWALSRPGSIITYATAKEKDIGRIIIPLFRQLTWHAPADVKPIAKTTREGFGLYFPNGSLIRLVGIDENPDGLRGQHSDGFIISEAGHVKDLEDTIRAVILPQFQRRPWARLILESNAPKQLGHDFDTVFVPDAKKSGAYVFQTIDDNEAISAEEKAKCIREAGGRGHPTCEREYYGVRTRDPSRTIVMEFDAARHVRKHPIPQYLRSYVAVDVGMRDMVAILWGYWDAARAKAVIQRDFAQRDFNTRKCAEKIAAVELELWGECRGIRQVSWPMKPPPKTLTYWDGSQFQANPYRRVSDTDLRFIGDMADEHKILLEPTDKTDSKEARLYALKTAFQNDQIEIWPECMDLIAHLTMGVWNKHRTDYERIEAFGHFDLVDALVYFWRAIDRTAAIPEPPALIDRKDASRVFMPWHQGYDQRSPADRIGRAVAGRRF